MPLLYFPEGKIIFMCGLVQAREDIKLHIPLGDIYNVNNLLLLYFLVRKIWKVWIKMHFDCIGYNHFFPLLPLHTYSNSFYGKFDLNHMKQFNHILLFQTYSTFIFNSYLFYFRTSDESFYSIAWVHSFCSHHHYTFIFSATMYDYLWLSSLNF